LAYRQAVREAITETWQKALDIPGLPEDEKIAFVNWERCPDDTQRLVRIGVEDAKPHTTGLGTSSNVGPLSGPSVVFNFEFENWSPDCRLDTMTRRGCITTIAAHEFGHVLGFSHEQNRPDTPESCKDAPQGPDGDTLIGKWDSDSVLNYCNPKWNNGGRLSQDDIRGVQLAYYPSMIREECGLAATPVAARDRGLKMRRLPAVAKPAR
jgi:hypothetical protein